MEPFEFSDCFLKKSKLISYFGTDGFSPPRLVAAGPPQFRGEDVEGHTTSGPGGVEKWPKTPCVFVWKRGLKGEIGLTQNGELCMYMHVFFRI